MQDSSSNIQAKETAPEPAQTISQPTEQSLTDDRTAQHASATTAEPEAPTESAPRRDVLRYEPTNTADTAWSDTLTLQLDGTPHQTTAGIPSVSVPANKGVPVQEVPDSLATIPWVVTVLLLLFVVLSIRFKNNFRFISSMVEDLVSVRHRNNMFDDTLRETSFMITLDLLCMGELTVLASVATRMYLPVAAALPWTHLLMICAAGVAALYLFQWVAYNLLGYIFYNRTDTKMWLRAFGTSQGLLGMALFPVTLAVIFNQSYTYELLVAAAVLFALARIIFIYKGFRIFFTQIGSWVLFLYYLCSLEVIPFILTVYGISALCGLWIA